MTSSGQRAEIIRQLRKHPLMLRALVLLLPKRVPIHLQEIAENLGVHKVSAHRAMSGLTGLKLAKVEDGSDARYRYFTITDSKREEVKELISAAKRANHIPIGRGLLSLGSVVEDQVMQGLSANGLRAELANPESLCDILIRTGQAKVGLDIKIITASLSERRFNEIVGHIMTSRVWSKQLPTFLIIVLIGAYSDELVETSRRVATQLHDSIGLDLRFLWVRGQPLDLDPTTVRAKIVEPIIKILDQWRLR